MKNTVVVVVFTKNSNMPTGCLYLYLQDVFIYTMVCESARALLHVCKSYYINGLFDYVACRNLRKLSYLHGAN